MALATLCPVRTCFPTVRDLSIPFLPSNHVHLRHYPWLMDEFGCLTVKGDVSVTPIAVNVPAVSQRYLIMGPTGAGKSSFIESLAGESQTLSISKDQLAGYTQNVAAYHIVNLFHDGQPIYLIDTPGFSDAKFSELEIMHMVRIWLKENGISYFHRIFYLMPIHETRLSGTKRRTIKMLTEFLRPSVDLRSIMFVTTMWDSLPNEKVQERAEGNFIQLQREIMKEFSNQNVTITRFTNNRDSAFEVLRTNDSMIATLARDIKSDPNLFSDLVDRIMNAQTNVELRGLLEARKRENAEILAKFIQQFQDIKPPPPGYEIAAQRTEKAILGLNALPSEHQPPEHVIRRGDMVPDTLSGKPGIKGLLPRLFRSAKQRGSRLFSK
ncbi:hypothetical protein CVT24_008512 [Panaeolus cyanescens]|uniref:G domain-containing protein n=1 Tax=Panaeolus cyanescens TaxID=181874 RepID=A0A409W4H0_9AGAR|nr:hypothetical protein CVT24_008512 [Panaeolus cyanescens]